MLRLETSSKVFKLSAWVKQCFEPCLKLDVLQIKPGLSSYAEDSAAAAKSLEPLLAQALENVPKELQVTAPASCLMCDIIRYICPSLRQSWEFETQQEAAVVLRAAQKGQHQVGHV